VHRFQIGHLPVSFLPDFKPFRVHHPHRHFNADQNAARKSIKPTRQRGAQRFFFDGKMGDLGSVLFIGGIEHALVGFSGVAIDVVERGEVPLVRWRKNGVVAALAGARRVSCRFGLDALGGAINVI
jgi:hypothetical protein